MTITLPNVLTPNIETPVDLDLWLLPGELAEEEEPDLWYRDNDHHDWTQLRTLKEAEDVFVDRSERSPWCTLVRIIEDEHGNAVQWNAIEVLGSTPDPMYVAGDVSGDNYAWFWSSWPEGKETGPRRTVSVGPDWFEAIIFDCQIVTISDALAQVKPALYAVLGVERQAPGYRWRDRSFDYSRLEHLRSPRK